jgi:hypothetical protein
VRSLTRACLAWGIGTLDARVKPVDHAPQSAAALDRMNADAERRSRFLPDADD